MIDLFVARPDVPAPRFAPIRSSEPPGDPASWERATWESDWRGRRAVAESLRASPELLADLACDGEVLVRIAVARNAAAPPDVLDLLARDESVLPRQAVAAHPGSTEETLAWLAADAHVSIRMWLADNHRVPEATRGLLRRAGADDRLQWIERRDARLAPADLDTLLGGGPWGREIVASLDAAPASVLRRLARDPIPVVVEAVAEHPHAPLEALRSIAAMEAHVGGRDHQMSVAQSRAARRLAPPPPPLRRGAWAWLVERWRR